MSNTIIQIKRSTEAAAPVVLQPGELAFTSNGDTLWIGSPSGSNTANVIHVASKISYSANSTQLGNSAGGSNTELVSSWAIKTYVDGISNDLQANVPSTAVVFSNNGVFAGNGNFTYDQGTEIVYIANTLQVANNVTITNNHIHVGNSTQNTVLSVEGVAVGGTITSGNVSITGTANVSSDINVGANVNITTSSITVGNSSVNSYITSTSVVLDGTLDVAGAVGITANTTTRHINPEANATYDLGNVNMVYNNAYLQRVVGANVITNTITGTIYTANQPNITNTGTLDHLTVTGNTTLNGNVFIGSDSSDIVSIIGVVNTNIIPSANLTYDVGSATAYLRDVYAGNAYFHDILATGNLTVQGTLTTIDTNNIVVEDPLIRLARNQANTTTFVDTSDIGFYGVYGNTSQTYYTGLARDASTNTYILFDSLTDVPDNVVNAQGITITTLNTYLLSGGLTTNSTSANLIANSTFAVGIVANSLTLSTKLAVTEGGTGQSSFTNNAVLFGNSAGALSTASGSNGQVLQITSNVPTFAGLDGGTF